MGVKNEAFEKRAFGKLYSIERTFEQKTRKKNHLYYEVIKMNNLIFKESFDWDKRFINDEKPTKHGKESTKEF